MKFTRQGVAVCSAVAFLFAFLFVVSETARATSQQKRGDNFARRSRKVGELYNRNCARCHGAAGRGDTPIGKIFKAPDFTDPEWWKKNANITSTKRLALIIARGKAGMPAFGKKLTKAQIKLLVSHVRRFRK
ncbi:MAG: c-type cytochrome [Acidobacteria bacterium]|nr:c-type cytochrome [Acidobacteriota bacterium]